ncbi:hypothetical protein DFJ73DRAFT_141409 [Zopfochytrium polystomum]|nr:hypothetical protein DFJ73DRAFT_141409 [Zopfochytrium polystomum]
MHRPLPSRHEWAFQTSPCPHSTSSHHGAVTRRTLPPSLHPTFSTAAATLTMPLPSWTCITSRHPPAPPPQQPRSPSSSNAESPLSARLRLAQRRQSHTAPPSPLNSHGRVPRQRSSLSWEIFWKLQIPALERIIGLHTFVLWSNSFGPWVTIGCLSLWLLISLLSLLSLLHVCESVCRAWPYLLSACPTSVMVEGIILGFVPFLLFLLLLPVFSFCLSVVVPFWALFVFNMCRLYYCPFVAPVLTRPLLRLPLCDFCLLFCLFVIVCLRFTLPPLSADFWKTSVVCCVCVKRTCVVCDRVC